MPQRKTALKKLHSDKAKRLRNTKIRTDLKKTIKKFLALVAAKNKAEASSLFKILVAKIDRAALKGIIHRNTAAHKRSQFARRLNGIA